MLLFFNKTQKSFSVDCLSPNITKTRNCVVDLFITFFTCKLGGQMQKVNSMET